jgi:microcystin-dependent protein
MPSTYSPSLRLELMGAGDQAGNWGNTTNTNLGSLIEQAITGVGSISMLAGSDTTLVAGSGIVDEARNAVLVLGGTLSANRNLIVPSVNKFYAVRNATSGGFSVVVKTSAGSGVTLENGFTQLIYCDGTNVVLASVPINSTNGNVAISGAATVGGALAVTGNTTVSGDLDVVGAVSSGGGVLMPTGSILEYGGTTAPTGWLLCNGASVSRTTYAALFDVIGTAYGSVDVNTFNVPDRRDRVAVGAGSTYLRGATGGATTSTTSSDGAHNHTGSTGSHTLTEAQIPIHTHGGTIRFVGEVNHDLTAGTTTITTGFAYDGGNLSGATGGGGSHLHTISTDGTHNHTTSTLQPYVASNFIIKT